MQCSCGASTKPGRAERSKQRAVLEFQVCPACGRCHFDALRIGGQVVAAGDEARRQFEALDAPEPSERPHCSPEKAIPRSARTTELDWRPTSEQPPRDQLIRVDYKTGGYYVGHGGFFDGLWDLIARWAPCRSDEGLIPWPTTTPLVGTPFDVDAAPVLEISLPPPTPTAELPPVGTNFAFAF
ncbi:hypothetical protein [Azotobacter salinestris]|uniref:hypothetical protein n=1 Tax=Azotobacter salinestris TaxID=69964 RepID=UPI0032DF7EA9